MADIKAYPLYAWKKVQDDRDSFAQTPDNLWAWFEERYGTFDFDPCPVNPQFDGLAVEWGSNNYVNPPFNALEKWLTKAIKEWTKGKNVVFLMPVRIHTKYFIEKVYPWIEKGSVEMYVFKRGLVFKGYTKPTPFGMMYLYFSSKQSPKNESPNDGSGSSSSSSGCLLLDNGPGSASQ